MGVVNYFSFTILTNILVATTLTGPWLRPDSAAARFFSRAMVRTAVAANIVLVGITYSLVLRRLWQPTGPQAGGPPAAARCDAADLPPVLVAVAHARIAALA